MSKGGYQARSGSLSGGLALGRQKSLPLDPAPAILPPVQDQRVPTRERRRLGGMSLAVLERLREGQVSNRELAEMFPAGAAWRSRLSDCRLWLESHTRETIRCEVRPGGLSLYTIEGVK